MTTLPRNAPRKPLDLDEEDYSPLFDTDFFDEEEAIMDDHALADILGDSRVIRRDDEY